MASPSKEVHILIPETCEYITINGKRGFADMIQLKIFEMRFSWIILVDPV